jgi:fatty acid desaturase
MATADAVVAGARRRAGGGLVAPGRLAALSERSDRSGLLRFAAHLATLAATGTLVWVSRGTLVLPLAMLLHGIVLVAMFAPLHECIHRTAFRSRRLNDAVAWFCAAPLLLPPTYFRRFHLAHHRHTQDPDRDPELASPKPATLGRYLWHVSGLPYWRYHAGLLARHATGRIAEEFVPSGERPRVIAEARLLLGLYVGVAAAALAFGSPAPLLLWVVPALLGQPALRLYLLAEHTGCELVPDMLTNTRTTFTSAPVRFLAWNMPYHAEHHLYPAVPFHALPQLHAEIRGRLRVTAPGYVAFHRWLLGRLREAPALRRARR